MYHPEAKQAEGSVKSELPEHAYYHNGLSTRLQLSAHPESLIALQFPCFLPPLSPYLSLKSINMSIESQHSRTYQTFFLSHTKGKEAQGDIQLRNSTPYCSMCMLHWQRRADSKETTYGRKMASKWSACGRGEPVNLGSSSTKTNLFKPLPSGG